MPTCKTTITARQPTGIRRSRMPRSRGFLRPSRGGHAPICFDRSRLVNQRAWILLVLWMGLYVRLPAQGWAQSVESGPGGPEHRYGLRVARLIDPRTVQVTLGPSFVLKVGTQPAAYRIVSATDPDFRHGLRATAVQHTAVPDDSPPAGWRGKRYVRHIVTLTLPRPMRSGCRYAVQVLGVHSQPVTGGRAAAWIEPMTD